MLNLQLARKYSKAMFELAQEEGKLIPFGDELASVKKDLASAPQLKGYLANPQIQRQDKKELLRKLFEGELSGTVLNFLYLLVDKRRIELFDAIEDIYRSLSNEARGIVVADVTSAQELTSAQQEKIQKKLATVTGKEVTLRTHRDESLIGGVVVRIGDKRIDGSGKGRLEEMTAQLLAN